MTDDDIDALKAGRDLDELIAKVVLGKSWDGSELINTHDGKPAHLPHYSTNLVAAFDLLDVLRKNGCEFHFQMHPDGVLSTLWREGDRFHCHQSDAGKLPLAICQIALKSAMQSQRESMVMP